MDNSKELQEFEDQIFDPKNNPITYNIDHSIEASVRYDFLVELFGKEKVDAIVSDFQKLYDHQYFLVVRKKLDDQI